MKRTAIILLSVLGFFLLAGIIFIFSIRSLFETKPVVRKDSVLSINLAGPITEHLAQNAIDRQLEGARLQMFDIYEGLKMAKVDDRIRGVYLRVSIPGLGWAKARGIRKAIADFKESGKFVVSFMPFCDEKSYYIALAADEIYLQPYSFVEFNGLASEVPFLKKTMQKLGADPQVESFGKYKSAGDIFTRDSMTDADREARAALLTGIYDEFVQTVVTTREIDQATFEARLNQGFYQSEDVFALGLVDSLMYQTAVHDLIKAKIYPGDSLELSSKSLNQISLERYAQLSPKDVGLKGGEKIGLIYALGEITSGTDQFDPLSGRTMGAQSIVSLLRSANDNKKIKAIVLRVDSPGGSGIASDMIWAEIAKVKKNKPVIISMSDVAASGGYWISMNSDAIIAEPTTITGSIGVVSMILDLSGTYRKLGINWSVVKKGEHADMLTDKRALTDQERQQFRNLTYDFYKTFVQKVADGRNMTWDEVNNVAQGRVWTGLRAMQLGLVDSLGGLDVALAVARQKANIAEDVATQWIVYPKPQGFLESILHDFNLAAAKDLAQSQRDVYLLQNIPDEFKSALKELAILQNSRERERMAILPFVPDIR